MSAELLVEIKHNEALRSGELKKKQSRILAFFREEIKKNQNRKGKRKMMKEKINSEYFSVEISSIERNHRYTCGTNGKVADQIKIEIQISKNINLQTHKDFYAELIRIIGIHLDSEIEGFLENTD